MPDYKVIDAEQLNADLKGVADTIRINGGASSELSFPEDFNTAIGEIFPTEEVGTQADLISQIKSALNGKVANTPNIQPLDITENGTYIAPDGVDGYSPVTVNVPTGGSEDVAAAIADRTITEFINNATAVGHSAFRGCKNLKTLDMPNAMTVADYAFYQCEELTALNLPSVTSIGQQIIYGCNKLKSLALPSLTAASQNALREAQYVETIDLPKLTTIPAQMFYGCRGLKTLILRLPTMVTLANTSAFTTCYRILGSDNPGFNPGGGINGYIYVPEALVEEYKADATWSKFIDNFRAIEDYPDICGG